MIEVSADFNEIAELQIGNRAQIFQRPTIHDIRNSGESTPRRNPRFKKTHYVGKEVKEPEVIDFPRPKRNLQRNIDQVEHSNLLTQIKADQNLSTKLTARLKRFDDIQQMKYIIMGKEHDDYYFKPYVQKIKKAMEDEKYQKYLTKKEKAIKEADLRPVPIRSNREANRIPTIRISRKGLQDPYTRHIERKKKEEELDRIINEAQGIPPPKPPKPRRGLDMNYYDRRKEVRFYTGRQEDAMKHGRKYFPQKFADDIRKDIRMLP